MNLPTLPCWSCGAQRSVTDALCPACGKVQPPLARKAGEVRVLDKFAILGLQRSFAIEAQQVEDAFRALSRKLHPDRFAKATPQERRFALEQSTLLNDAVRTLRDPVRRAEHLLELRGVRLGEDGARVPGQPHQKLVMPPEFLEQAMEDREQLLEAKMEGDPAALEKLAQAARVRRDEALARVGQLLASDQPDLDAAAHELAKLRYTARYLDEIEGRSPEM